MLPGAQPRANPAARAEFEGRCKQLHREEIEEKEDARQQLLAAAGEHLPVGKLLAIFPTLDASLVRSLAADAPTRQDLIDTLMALAAAAPAVQDTGTGDSGKPSGPLGSELPEDPAVSQDLVKPETVVPEPAAGAAVHDTEADEVADEVHAAPAVAGGGGGAFAELEAMFPTLDAALVRSLAAESPSLERAVDTLMALAASTEEPVAQPEVPPRDTGLNDVSKFPSLTKGGREPPGGHSTELGKEKEESTDWRDRAKSAAALPDPAPGRRQLAVAQARKRASAPAEADPHSDAYPGGRCADVYADEHAVRQERGQRRAKRIAERRAARGGVRGQRVAEAEEDGESLDHDATDAV